MRRSFISVFAAVFAFACAEAPTAPLLTASAPPSFGFSYDYPPPPFTMVDGSAQVDGQAFSFTAKFFANKPGNVAWLQFVSSPTATFSSNARIMSVNGTVSGIGTITVAGSTYNLRNVTDFNYQTYRLGRGVSFGDRNESFGGYAFNSQGGGEVICCDAIIDR